MDLAGREEEEEVFENSKNPLNHLPAFPSSSSSLRLSASFPLLALLHVLLILEKVQTVSHPHPLQLQQVPHNRLLLQKQILARDGRMHDGNGLMAMAENSIDFWQQPSELVGLPP